MSKCNQSQPFQVTGQLIDIVWKEGCIPKYFKLLIDGRELWIKIAKELRREIDPRLTLGSWVIITGLIKQAKKTGILKLRAETLEVLHAAPAANDIVPLTPPESLSSPQAATILICQKSDCRKRGANRVCEQLQATLEQAGLSDQVKIKKTGCLKQCKQGPNVVFMPDKAKYSRVHVNDVAPLVHKHVARNAVSSYQ